MVAAAAQAVIDKAFGRFVPSFGVLDPSNLRRDSDAHYIPVPDVLCYHLVCAYYCLCRWGLGRDRERSSIRISSVVGLLAARVD